MARKQPSFRQLIAYLHKAERRNRDVRTDADAPDLIFTRNLYADPVDRSAVAAEFEANHAFLPRRKNGNALYHEVIVLEQAAGVAQDRQAEILLELAERYCSMRAPGQLAYGRVHQDRDHQHIHLMLSANAVRSPRRVRLQKARFAEIQRDLEAYKLERFPELAPLRVYDQGGGDRDKSQARNREQEAIRREGRPSKKQALADRLRRLFENAADRADLEARLATEGLSLYRRGKFDGIEDRRDGKRCRLKTLGLEAAFKETLTRFERSSERPGPRRAPERPFLPEPLLDPRAEALLRRRALEHAARERLNGFDLER